jgi:glycosyltransferase involved in cell wall biosynthesis
VFVLPSTGRLEAFGIVVLEAMATAKPVIVTDIPGVRELVRHRKEGLIVEPFDVRALAQAIETLIGDRDLRNRMGSSARERVLTNFTWDKLARDTEKIYEDVLAEK